MSSQPQAPRRRRPLALYDADCGFCTLSAGWIPRLGADVDVSSLQAEDLQGLGVDEARTTTEMPVVLPDGRVAWGHHAWAEILQRCPVPLRWAGVALDAPVLERVGSATYRWIASHRHQLPGGTAACALPEPGTTARPGSGGG